MSSLNGPEGASRLTPPRFLALFLVAVAARVGTVAFGSALAALPPDPYSDPRTPTDFRAELLATARPLEAWFRFDAIWCANVARRGYAGASGEGGKLGPAFQPVVPAVMAAADALGLNAFWAVMLTASLAGAAGAAVFAQVAARLLNEPAAGWRALALLLTFPTAFFFSAPYHESFGLLFTAIALSAWMSNRAAVAGLSAFAGSLARLTGVALGVAAIADWLSTRDRTSLARTVWVVAGSFAGIAAFWCFLWWAVGDPLAGLQAHRHWGRPPLSWKNPLRTIESIYDPQLTHYGEAVVVLGVAVLGIRAWRKRGAFWGLVALVPVAQVFASGTLLSAHRVALACLPAFVELADLLRGRRAPLVAVVAVFAYAQLVLLSRYVHWQFAG